MKREILKPTIMLAGASFLLYRWSNHQVGEEGDYWLCRTVTSEQTLSFFLGTAGILVLLLFLAAMACYHGYQVRSRGQQIGTRIKMASEIVSIVLLIVICLGVDLKIFPFLAFKMSNGIFKAEYNYNFLLIPLVKGFLVINAFPVIKMILIKKGGRK